MTLELGKIVWICCSRVAKQETSFMGNGRVFRGHTEKYCDLAMKIDFRWPKLWQKCGVVKMYKRNPGKVLRNEDVKHMILVLCMYVLVFVCSCIMYVLVFRMYLYFVCTWILYVLVLCMYLYFVCGFQSAHSSLTHYLHLVLRHCDRGKDCGTAKGFSLFKMNVKHQSVKKICFFKGSSDIPCDRCKISKLIFRLFTNMYPQQQICFWCVCRAITPGSPLGQRDLNMSGLICAKLPKEANIIHASMFCLHQCWQLVSKPQPAEGWQTGRTSWQWTAFEPEMLSEMETADAVENEVGTYITDLECESAAWAVTNLTHAAALASLLSNIPTPKTVCSSVSSQTWERGAGCLNTRLSRCLSQKGLAASIVICCGFNSCSFLANLVAQNRSSFTWVHGGVFPPNGL